MLVNDCTISKFWFCWRFQTFEDIVHIVGYWGWEQSYLFTMRRSWLDAIGWLLRTFVSRLNLNLDYLWRDTWHLSSVWDADLHQGTSSGPGGLCAKTFHLRFWYGSSEIFPAGWKLMKLIEFCRILESKILYVVWGDSKHYWCLTITTSHLWALCCLKG